MGLLKRKDDARAPVDDRQLSLDKFRAVQGRIEHEIGVLQRDLEAAAKVTAAAEQRVSEARQREATLREGIRDLAHDLDRERARHERVLRTCEDPRVPAFLDWLRAEQQRVADAVRERVEFDHNLNTGQTVPRVVADNRASVQRTLEALRECRSTAALELPFTPAHELDAVIDRLRRAIPPVEGV